MAYTIQTSVSADFGQVVETTIDALEDEGFGVLCDIDVQATLKEKLGEALRQYRILDACNPVLAHEGLNEEIELGALLPCNVIVFAAGRVWGLDAYLERTEFVRTNSWVRYLLG